MEEVVLQAKDDLELSVAVANIKHPRALMQLIRGTMERRERYYKFMKFLDDDRFATITSDNRGHGLSVNKKYPPGYMGDYEGMIEDQMVLTRYIKARHPGRELHLFGHSFGSLLTRYYFQQHDDKIRKLVLSGVVNYIPAVSFGILLGRLIIGVMGKQWVNRLFNSMGVNGRDDGWVSTNKENSRAYRSNKLCQYPYSNSTIMTIFESGRSLHQYEKYQCQSRDLPILSMTRADDPVTEGKKGLADTMKSLERVGYHDITNKVYQGMKHGVLNEYERVTVYQGMVDFLLGEKQAGK